MAAIWFVRPESKTPDRQLREIFWPRENQYGLTGRLALFPINNTPQTSICVLVEHVPPPPILLFPPHPPFPVPISPPPRSYLPSFPLIPCSPTSPAFLKAPRADQIRSTNVAPFLSVVFPRIQGSGDDDSEICTCSGWINGSIFSTSRALDPGKASTADEERRQLPQRPAPAWGWSNLFLYYLNVCPFRRRAPFILVSRRPSRPTSSSGRPSAIVRLRKKRPFLSWPN